MSVHSNALQEVLPDSEELIKLGLQEKIRGVIRYLDSPEACEFQYPANRLGAYERQGILKFVVLVDSTGDNYYFIRAHAGDIRSSSGGLELPSNSLSISWFDANCSRLHSVTLRQQSANAYEYTDFSEQGVATINISLRESEDRSIERTLGLVDFMNLKMGAQVGEVVLFEDFENALNVLQTSCKPSEQLTSAFLKRLETRYAGIYDNE